MAEVSLKARGRSRSREFKVAKMFALALLLGSSTAFVFQSAGPSTTTTTTTLGATKAETVELAEANPDLLGKTLGFWDPLGALDTSFWGIGNEATIGYLRHAEIKHGRVAMAAFLGFCAQSTPLVSGPHTILPYKGYEAGLSPQEQWDNIPLWGKLQIFTLIGMLESYGEILDPHYCDGGLPGYYPPIKGKGLGQIPYNLFDPFDFGFRAESEEKKARGRLVEINNGRLAMFGILGFLSEASTPGSVPLLTGLIKPYSGNCMIPFEGDFTIFS
eukprot:CAMPEP_0118895206 /NCGR_PEP_ID=MMETSP1166-20130328/3659_1 /TAXON_ID=1104430 /ORGANISM="Chrysoreinhardia sp, Strain CCMP3193" /LENGTH=272 /DNA_ID=CAMNT_0006834209 /DNA_START=31 /DNA_END=849 /DNA_ORIENTATION=-